MDKYTVPTLEKTFEIVELISKSSEGASFTEMVNSLSLPKTTVFRILRNLEERNWIEKKNDKYALGFMFIHYGLVTLAGRDLRNIARPYLRELSEKINETTHIAILSGKQSMIIESYDSPHHIKPSSLVGALLPLHCTSHGKILLAFAVKEPPEQFLAGIKLEKRTENTIVDIGALKREISVVRERGYAIDDNEYFPDIRCLAVPVYGAGQDCIAALGITAMASSFREEKAAEYSTLVLQTSAAVSREMGGNIK